MIPYPHHQHDGDIMRMMWAEESSKRENREERRSKSMGRASFPERFPNRTDYILRKVRGISGVTKTFSTVRKVGS